MPTRAERPAAQMPIPAHGAAALPAVIVDEYSTELRSQDGFLGDQASNTAFKAMLEWWRKRLRKLDSDPLGDTPLEAISRRQLDDVLREGDPEAAGLVHGVVEEFAQNLARVLRRLLHTKAWKGVERIAVGGGMRGSRVGEIAIGRAALLLKDEGETAELAPIRHDPDEAGLIGGLHLAPPWIFAGHDGALAVDIGGSNIRTGIVCARLKKAPDLSAAEVRDSELWRHADDSPKRDEAIERLVDMLRDLARKAEKRDFNLAPFVAVGCPGRIREDGGIERGAQNLPGNWETSRFNLPGRIREGLPEIGGHETVVVLHNDAVVQGLSQAPFMQDVRRWGVVTIGTGLGNAVFTNRRPED
ncbi:ROK family protein [Crenalkalicoccus roseus]|uniref:ROK family protein n=1 Tax=Crenalkalicoccus roseus TaxID=1485588 RepID=UPI00108216B7|nr:ROK family protein [Crenalkalicoccus roseus]